MPYVPLDPLSGAGYVAEAPERFNAAENLQGAFVDNAESTLVMRRAAAKKSLIRQAVQSVFGAHGFITDQPNNAVDQQEKGLEDL